MEKKKKIKLGYNRKSTISQSLESDRSVLESYGCDKIFEEKKSGKSIKDRVELQSLMQEMKSYSQKGFEVEIVAVKIDRLARSIKDLSNLIDEILQAGASINFLNQNLKYSNESDPMSKAFVSMLGIFAELERDFIVSRTSEGKRYKRENDPNFKDGRKKKLIKEDIKELYEAYESGTSVIRLSKRFNVSRQTIYTYLKEAEYI